MEKLADHLVNKSIEAFILAIEVYNKPTIQYRTEGFSSFIVNAWELMIKAHMINKFGEESIYFKDNPERTLSLSACIDKVFTNVKDPLSLNLKRIVELRNLSTHFVTKEYDIIYAPLFQACVLNYVDKMYQFHDVDVTERIPENFLVLPIRVQTLDENKIRAAYSKRVSDRLFQLAGEIGDASDKEGSKFAIKIVHEHYITKNKNEATQLVCFSKNDDAQKVQIIKERVDPSLTHKLKVKDCVNYVNRQLKRRNIKIYYKGEEVSNFNRTHFINFCKYFLLKEDERYCYKHEPFGGFSYSQQIVDFIVATLEKNPSNTLDIVANKDEKKR